MNQRRLLVSSYVACTLLAVGSIGPWTTFASEVSLGVDGDGLLTLGGAMIVAVSLWRWSESRRRLMLNVGQIVAALCVAITVYSMLDIYLLDGGGINEGFRAGWGLIAALGSAAVLTVLCGLLRGRTQVVGTDEFSQ